ncbi:MAG: NAD(P)-dependent oxidoreductase [Candidatus Liptonbacteria bacterium]|nr:NAD(P)-dependent oxidoreductase [Candidatus Liptonbacteria bacterium]
MNSNIKRVLVVGGAGYVGGAVTDELLEKKIPFTVFDSLVYEERYLKPVDFVYGDVRDKELLKKILPEYSHVIWLAAIVGDGACSIHPEAAVEINELAPKWLSENFDGRIIFTSTCSVYGHREEEATEEHDTAPVSLYGVTKVDAEKYLLKKNAVILRLGTAFGISDTFSRPRTDLMINTFATNAAAKGKIMVFGGSQWRPNIHVRDIAKVIVSTLDSPLKGVYNVATQNFSVEEIAKKVQAITGCDLQYAGQFREDKRNYRVSFAKALKDGVLTLPTDRDVEYGVREFVTLVKEKRMKNIGHSAYSNAKHLSQYSF